MQEKWERRQNEKTILKEKCSEYILKRERQYLVVVVPSHPPFPPISEFEGLSTEIDKIMQTKQTDKKTRQKDTAKRGNKKLLCSGVQVKNGYCEMKVRFDVNFHFRFGARCARFWKTACHFAWPGAGSWAT